jgi:hypothetical protein
MPDENHGSVVLRAHYWGLKMIFDGWQLPTNPDSRSFEGTLEDLERHYAELSKQYGFNVIPSENTINIVGYQILGREDYDEAIAVFLSNVRLYPESANVYDSLGEAYENAGQYEEALKAYTTAVENAHKTGDVRLGIFTDNRARVKNLLAERKAD